VILELDVLIADTTWADIETLRGRISEISAVGTPRSLLMAAEELADLFNAYSSIVLARVFLVLPFESMPARERASAEAFVDNDPRLVARTPVLSLLATRGRKPEWNDRERSRGHRAIPLLDQAFVQGAPMIARLLADLEVNLKALDDGRPIVTRRMLGGRNGAFYVDDAQSARDALGRPIIPAQDFVAEHAIRTVFGMGGAYVHGQLVVAIMFCTELLDRLVVDRFPSLISNFKMATAPLIESQSIYEPAPDRG
jgi:hypothetical protein